MGRIQCTFAVAILLGAAFSARTQPVTYTLENETPLLDAAFYNQAPAGRFAIGAALSNRGQTFFVTALDVATVTSQFYLVDAGNPSSWRRILSSESFPLANEPIFWTPDDSHVVYYNLRFDLARDRVIDDTVYWNQHHGIWFLSGSMTRRASDNWRCAVSNTLNPENPDSRELVLLPVLPSGDPDASRDPVQITFLDITAPAETIWSPYISADGSSVVFNWVNRPSKEIRVYAINDLDAIVAAHQPGTLLSPLAPASLSDPALTLIRNAVNQSLGGAALSTDESLVFMQQDFNGAFDDDNVLGSLPLADFDVVVAHATGADPGYRVVAAGNQFGLMATPGGTRVLYFRDVSGVVKGFIASLRAATPVAGNPVGDNGIETATDQAAADGSGTIIGIPSGVVIDFPPGAPQEIQIATPAIPVAEAQLPPDAGINAIPVVRAFGPPGTVFSTPISVTVSYTDAEVEGLDEPNLEIFLYNEISGLFDIPVTTIVARDIVNNTISFTVDHFSTFGLGAEADTDGDSIGDNTDPDDDNDGVPDALDSYPLDTDDDGIDNPEDPDDDSDGIPDSSDVSPFDTDNDGDPNATDPDDDGDQRPDAVDARLFDTDNDGLRNDVDGDDDNDGISDIEEGDADVDGDGLANSIDRDSDGDGAPDSLEHSLGTDPYDYLNPTEVPVAAWPSALALAALGACATRRKRYKFQLR